MAFLAFIYVVPRVPLTRSQDRWSCATRLAKIKLIYALDGYLSLFLDKLQPEVPDCGTAEVMEERAVCL